MPVLKDWLKVTQVIQVSRYCLLNFLGQTCDTLNRFDFFSMTYLCSGSFKSLLKWLPNVVSTGPKFYNYQAYCKYLIISNWPNSRPTCIIQYTDRKMQYYTIGLDAESDMQYLYWAYPIKY